MLENNFSIKKIQQSSVVDYSGKEPSVVVNEIRYNVLYGSDTLSGEIRVVNSGFNASIYGLQADKTEEVDTLVNKMFDTVSDILSINKIRESIVTNFSGDDQIDVINEIIYQIKNKETPLGEVRIISNGFSISAFGFQDAITQDIDAIVTKMFNAVKA